jgi:hypothetical protein
MKIYFAKQEKVVFSVTHVQLAVYIPVKIQFNTIVYYWEHCRILPPHFKALGTKLQR